MNSPNTRLLSVRRGRQVRARRGADARDAPRVPVRSISLRPPGMAEPALDQRRVGLEVELQPPGAVAEPIGLVAAVARPGERLAPGGGANV